MFLFHPILLSGLTGFLSGLLLCIPVGPVNLTVMNEGARQGFKWALLISLGGTVMEVIYCSIAFAWFASPIFSRRYVKEAMELFGFVFMLFLGIRFLSSKSVEAPVHLGLRAHRLQEKIGEQLHPRSAFMIGFVRVLGNLGVLAGWIVLAASFTSHGWVTPDWPGKLACIAGVALGTYGWFVVMSYSASRGHGKLSDKTLLRMEHISGVILLGVAVFYGCEIIWQLAQHKA